MDKLQMAHDFAMKLISVGATNKTEDIIRLGWEYADAMQKEADSHTNKDRPAVLHEEFQPTGYETGSDEWQPDWSQAPKWANWWAVDESKNAHWYKQKPSIDEVEFYSWTYEEAPTFGYQGDWKDSLRERP